MIVNLLQAQSENCRYNSFAKIKERAIFYDVAELNCDWTQKNLSKNGLQIALLLICS